MKHRPINREQQRSLFTEHTDDATLTAPQDVWI